ncbi:MAG: FlgD immunoglobulin-like domain containing protein [Thermoleophilaceae bacterium]
MRNRASLRVTPLLAATFLVVALFPSLSSQAAPATAAAPRAGAVAEWLELDRKATKAKLTPKALRAARPLDMSVRASQLDQSADGAATEASGEPVSVAPSAPAARAGAATKLDAPSREAAGASAADYPYVRTEVTDTVSYPNRTHGKLFMLDAGGFPFAVCSGTSVTSDEMNLVWTAGHCVHEGGAGGDFFPGFAFIPGYRNGAEPYGVWFAERVVTTPEWAANADFDYDVAAMVMEPNGGTELGDVVGTRGIRFNQDPDQFYNAYGYPAAPPFDGEKMYRCDADLGLTLGSGSLAPMGIGCDMTGGSSGGGWIVGLEFVQSVNSFKIVGDPEFEEVMFGPQMRADALEVYTEATGGEPEEDTTPPKLTKVTDGPDPFTPLAKKKRKTTIKFTLNELAVVVLKIKNKSGKTVYKIPATELSPDRYFTKWNGKHFKSGKVVKAGTYTYKITATDMADNSASKSKQVTVKR